MEKALERTRYCDHDHPDVRDLSRKFAEGADDPVDIVQRSFLYVRDRIPFGFDLYERTASETLATGHGACWNKSLLLMALLRGAGVPARFGSIPVKREFMAPVFGKMSRLINNPYNHCVALVRLHGKWVVLDAVLDAGAYDAFYRPLNVGWGIDWDGETDCRLYTENVLGPPATHRDVDEAVRTKAGNSEAPKFIAVRFNNLINKWLWKRTGIKQRSVWP